jgi:hypothetical protein
MADLVTDFRGGGQAGHRDTPKGGVSRPVPPLVGTNVTSCPVPVPCPKMFAWHLGRVFDHLRWRDVPGVFAND